MKSVQTAVTDAEHELLRRRAEEEGKSMKQVMREALRDHLLVDQVDADDPIFRVFPLIRATGKKRRASVDHDSILYRRL